MNASIWERLEPLMYGARPPLLVLIDVTEFPETDRDAFLSGDDAIQRRYGARDGEEDSPGTIHTLVISIHPELRESWLLARDMDEDEVEANEQRRIHEEQRREWETREAQEWAALEAVRATQVRYDYSGYPIPDHAVR